MRDQTLSTPLPVPACKQRAQGVLWTARPWMRKELLCSLLVYLGYTTVLCAQAFQNLDFESATLVPLAGSYGYSFNLALPGWSGFSGTDQLNAALYDNAALDSTVIGIIDTNVPYVSGLVIQGNYTAFLEAGLQLGSSTTSADASLSQTGLVPLGTKSLSFLAVTNGPFAVSLGGTTLNLISSPVAGHNYSLFQADITAFAGQTEELDFAVFAENPYNNFVRSLVLDDIQFSPEAVPEPSGLSLLIVGVASLAFWPRARRRTA